MVKNNILYFIIGVFVTLVIMIFISATNEVQTEVGRYQITGDSYTTILDTKTGIAKYLSNTKNEIIIYDFNNDTVEFNKLKFIKNK